VGLDPSWKQWGAAGKGYGRNRDDDFVQYTGVHELASKITATDDPYVVSAGRGADRREVVGHRIMHKAHIRPGRLWKFPGGEHEHRSCAVVLLPLVWLGEHVGFLQEPFVSR